MNPNVLKRFLWGKYYYKASEKKIVKTPPSTSSQEMFVQFVIGPMVQQYRKFYTQEIQGNTQELKSAQYQVKELMSKWSPADRAIFSMVVEHLPSPLAAQKVKVDTFA